MEVGVVPGEGGASVRSDRPLSRVEVFTEDGLPVLHRDLPTPTTEVFLPLGPGRYRVVGIAGTRAADAGITLAAPPDLSVRVSSPFGHVDEDQVALVAWDGQPASAALEIEATTAQTVEVDIGEQSTTLTLTPGVGARVPFQTAGPLSWEVRGDVRRSGSVSVVHWTQAEARRMLDLGATLPVDAQGAPDRARARDRIAIPSRWWQSTLSALGVGYRPRSDQAPWCWESISVTNRSASPVDVVVRAGVRRGDAEAPAFRPVLRDHNLDHVRVIARIPATDTAHLQLPIYVDRERVASGVVTRWIEVIPVGADQPMHRQERALQVRVGGWVSAGLGVAGAVSMAGLFGLVVRGPGWLRRAPTVDLVTVAMFAALTFVVGTASQLVGMGLGIVLGPFSPLVTGVLDGALRACLLGTLVVLLPRPGVLALATVIGFGMRGLALGSFHPVDLLYVGSAIFWLEGFAWITGLTRTTAWREQGRGAQWLRLGLGLGLAHVAATATGLIVSASLYRLYYTAWYVALMLGLPGFLYVLTGCWVAVDFAASLRRVES